MATITQLEEQKKILQSRLDSGDLSAEAALELVDRAISSRSKQVNYSQKRLKAVKAAVKKGVPFESTRPKEVSAAVKKRAKKKRSLNNF